MPKRERRGIKIDRKQVTQKDVAERAGVAPSIVSYVINNGPRTVSEATRQRVQQAIEALGYRPNVHAQQLMRAVPPGEQVFQQFGVILGGPRTYLARPYYNQVMLGILQESSVQNLAMRFGLFYDELINPVIVNKFIHPEEILGLLLINVGGLFETEQGIQYLKKFNARIENIISIGRALPGIPSVLFDLTGAIYKTTSYLIELGHRRIAFIGTAPFRLEGFRNALSDHGVPCDDARIKPFTTKNSPENGYRAVQELADAGQLRGPQRVTSIVAGSDEVALGAMRALYDAGLRIPADVSIIGLDDQPLDAYLNPPLTTVKIPTQELGICAMQLLRQQINHASQLPPVTPLPTELIVRASCAPFLNL